MMKTIYADLHIHIGRTYTGKPVKITGAKTLTPHRILEEASEGRELNYWASSTAIPGSHRRNRARN